VHHRVNPYPGARRENETEMFSDHDETSPSITAVSAKACACKKNDITVLEHTDIEFTE